MLTALIEMSSHVSTISARSTLGFPCASGGQSSAQNNSAMLVDDEAGEEEDDQDELPAKVAARSADARGRRTVLEDSSDEEMGDAQPQPATGACAVACVARSMCRAHIYGFCRQATACVACTCQYACRMVDPGCRLSVACSIGAPWLHFTMPAGRLPLSQAVAMIWRWIWTSSLRSWRMASLQREPREPRCVARRRPSAVLTT